jgi:hypothetical protein
MSVPPGGPQQGYGPPYPGYAPPPSPPPRRRSPVPWVLGAALVVVAAVVVTLVLTLGGDDDKPGGGTAKPGNNSRPTDTYDLSSPEAAAESFVAAAKTRNADTVLSLTCIGTSECVSKHARGASRGEIEKAKDTIRQGVGAYADQYDGAEFGKPRKGSEPGTMEVPYRIAGRDTEVFMTFIEFEGKWLWYGGGAGGSSGGGGGGGGGGGRDANTPTSTPG